MTVNRPPCRLATIIRLKRATFSLRSIYQLLLSPSDSYPLSRLASVLLLLSLLKTDIGRGRCSPASVPSSPASGVLPVLGVPMVLPVLGVLGAVFLPGSPFYPVLL